MTAQSEDKAFLRRRAKEYRKSLLPEEKARRDKFVTDNLFALDEFKNAKTVLCYVSSSSITRFVRTLGYDSYKQFKNDIDNTLTIDVDYSKRINMATAEDLKAHLSKIYRKCH